MKPNTLGCLYVAVASVIWGSNGVIVNLVPLNAYVIAFFRVLFASLTLLPFLIFKHRSEMRETARAWKSMLALGGLLALGWVFLFQSMKLIAISNAVLLNYLAPVFVALLAPIMLKEKIEKFTIPALVMSLAGIVIISSQQKPQAGSLDLLGIAFGLLAGLGYAAFIIASKATVAKHSSHVVAFYAYLVTTVLLSPSLIEANLLLEKVSWILLLIMGSFNTGFAVTLYLKGLNLVKAQKAVVFTYLEPLSATIFGYLFLAQPLTIHTLIGGTLILSAGYIVASK